MGSRIANPTSGRPRRPIPSLPGLIALLAILAVIGAATTGLVRAATDLDLLAAWTDPYLWSVLRFTVLQAGLSTLISIAVAIPVARALSRRRFPGRTLLLRLFGLPMVVPAVAGAFGILTLFGRSGLLAELTAALGWPLRPNIYGLTGILMAHVFFNMPFAVRVLLAAWATIPAESWRLAAMLGLRGSDLFRLVEWPVLRRQLPGLAALIFLLCFTSFAVVLTLGSGPASATIEIAIYQALRFDFDPGRAVALSLLQVALCALMVLAAMRLTGRVADEGGIGRPVLRTDGGTRTARAIDTTALALAAGFVVMPLLAILVEGLGGLGKPILASAMLWRAAGRSLAVALGAGLIALALGWALAHSIAALRIGPGVGQGRRRRLARLFELSGTVVLVVPPLAIGAGLFVTLLGTTDLRRWALVIVALVNALMALPFVLRLLVGAAELAQHRHGRLADSLGLSGWARLRLVEWPLLRRPAGFALALATGLAFGDLGVAALFGSDGNETLPVLVAQLLGAYRLQEASTVVLLLVLFGLLLFALIERSLGGRERG
ncbi:MULTISPECIES: thiamine/thiamine pyrophosphate ABC transporter permease [Inquilinus]|uniref:Thiamine transport system permease protein ThiP n=1 Tax=Inquilinus ginsengisoli TaxID=363840 RepID=A0ABU1JWS1_9PROT|nr:thiamine/thiamine pyrophosphate ABC transporter permease [Inquilinus ginsengisoli]MDR6293058.1 thiamine transport system permease protein [Inquilinus ginsengisoli]